MESSIKFNQIAHSAKLRGANNQSAVDDPKFQTVDADMNQARNSPNLSKQKSFTDPTTVKSPYD